MCETFQFRQRIVDFLQRYMNDKWLMVHIIARKKIVRIWRSYGKNEWFDNSPLHELDNVLHDPEATGPLIT